MQGQNSRLKGMFLCQSISNSEYILPIIWEMSVVQFDSYDLPRQVESF